MHSAPLWTGARLGSSGPGAGLVREETRPWGRPATAAPRPPVPAFVPRSLLAWQLPDAPEEELAALVESQLVRLNACEARLDLEIGAAMHAFPMADVHALGHGTRDAFCHERLGFSSGHATELKKLELHLRDLPLLRAAFLAGAVPRTRLRRVAGVATKETQAGWLLLARSLTMAQLNARVAEAKAEAAKGVGASPATEPPEASERVTFRVTADEGTYLACVGLPMMRAVVGQEGPKHVLMEALAAETLSDVGPETDTLAAVGGREGVGENRAGRRASRAARRRAVRTGVATDRKARNVVHRLVARLGGLPAFAWPLPAGRFETLPVTDKVAHVERLASWRRSIEYQRARLLDLFKLRSWHRERGFRNFYEWLDRRLGISPAEGVTLCRLSKDLAPLQAITEAWSEGILGWSQAGLLGKVASRETAPDWVAYAREATKKRVETDVAAQLVLRAKSSELWLALTEGGRPMRTMPVAALRFQWELGFESAAHRQRAERERRKAEAGGSCKSSRAGAPESDSARRQPGDDPLRDVLEFASASRRHVTFAFNAPPEVAALLREAMRQVRRAAGTPLTAGACLMEMFARFGRTHVVPGLVDFSLRSRVLRRDGYVCSMPHCRSRRNLEAHHANYRSHGGPDDMRNLTTLCRACHRLQHAGCVSIEPEGVQTTRAGAGPAMRIRVGRAGPRCAPAWYREGIRAG